MNVLNAILQPSGRPIMGYTLGKTRQHGGSQGRVLSSLHFTLWKRSVELVTSPPETIEPSNFHCV